MRAYLVTATVPAKKGDEDAQATELKAYAGSQSDAAETKRNWLDKHGDDGLKRSAVRIDPVDIPTDKGNLIPWLNKNAV